MVRELLDLAALRAQLDLHPVLRETVAQDGLGVALADHPGVDLGSVWLVTFAEALVVKTYKGDGGRRLARLDGIVGCQGLDAPRQLVVPEGLEGDAHLPHLWEDFEIVEQLESPRLSIFGLMRYQP